MSATVPTNIIYAMYDFYRNGHSSRETAHKFQVSNTTVRAAFRRMGLPVRNRTHALILRCGADRDETAAMYADYKAGMNKSQIGRKYGLTRTAIRYRFCQYGYTRKGAA